MREKVTYLSRFRKILQQKKAFVCPQLKDVLFYCLAAPTHRHDKCMEIALQMGADVNSKSNDGTPIFVEACKDAEERKNICFMLLEHGSDSAVPDEVASFSFSLITS